MIKKINVLFFLCCITAFVATAQTTAPDFKKELSEKQFKAVKVKDLPMDVIQLLGCDSRDWVGTKMGQTGCGGPKKIVIIWAQTDGHGMYVMRANTCGAYTTTYYYVIADGKKYELDRELADFRNFNSFKKSYLE